LVELVATHSLSFDSSLLAKTKTWQLSSLSIIFRVLVRLRIAGWSQRRR